MKLTYFSSQTGAKAGRDDPYRSFNGRLGTKLFKQANVAVLFQSGSTSTNAFGLGFGSKQYGFEIGLRF